MKTEKVLDTIFEMKYEDLMRVFKAATFRWGELFPDWNIITMSVPRNDPQHKKEIIDFAFKMVDREIEEKLKK